MEKARKIKYAYVFAATIKDDLIYLASCDYKIIFVLDKNTKKIIDYIVIDDITNTYCVSEMIIVDKYIYTIPFMGSYINKILNNTKIDSIKIDKKNNRVVYAGCIIDDKTWLLPLMNSDNMYLVDGNCMQMKVFPSVFKCVDFPHEILKEYNHTVFTTLKKTKNKIWFAVRLGSQVLCFDYSDMKWKKYDIGIEIIDFTYAENFFWFLSNDAIIYRWDSESEDIRVWHKIDKNKLKNKKENTLIFSYITYRKHFLWCLPDFSDTICAINTITKEEKNIQIYNNYKNERICGCYIWDEIELYIFSQMLESMWTVNSETYQVNTIKLNIPLSVQSNLIKMISDYQIIDERILSLELFLENCIHSKDREQQIDVGELIYRQLR